MLQNAYLDAKIGFDTEENEPPKVWGELFIIHYSFFIRLLTGYREQPLRPAEPHGVSADAWAPRVFQTDGRAVLGV